MRWGLASIALACGCGTYSFVRTADTLPAGQVELGAGLAVSQLEANTIVHGAVGLTDEVELLAQNEIWNSYVEARYGVLRSARDGLGLAIGAGLGHAVTLVSALDAATDDDAYDRVDDQAATVSLAIGTRWDHASLTLGHRTFYLLEGYLASSTRLSARWFATGRAGLFLEAGATVHAPTSALDAGFAIGEGAAGAFVGF